MSNISMSSVASLRPSTGSAHVSRATTSRLHSTQSNKQLSSPQTSSLGTSKEPKRCSRACNTCRSRRARCEGGDPCLRCSKAGIQCIFNTGDLPQDNVLQKSQPRSVESAVFSGSQNLKVVSVMPKSNINPYSVDATPSNSLRLDNVNPTASNHPRLSVNFTLSQLSLAINLQKSKPSGMTTRGMPCSTNF
jgi:hypothetical protein